MAPASVSVAVGAVLAGMLALAAFILSRYETRGGQGRAVRRSDLAQSVRGGATGARLLGLYRVLAFLYTLGVHVHSLVYEMPPYQAYRFYTVWSYTALILYFGVAACHSLSAPSPRSSEKPQPLRSPNEIRLDASPFGLSHPPHLLSTAPVRIFPGYATVVLANLVWLNVWVVDTVLWTVTSTATGTPSATCANAAVRLAMVWMGPVLLGATAVRGSRHLRRNPCCVREAPVALLLPRRPGPSSIICTWITTWSSAR